MHVHLYQHRSSSKAAAAVMIISLASACLKTKISRKPRERKKTRGHSKLSSLIFSEPSIYIIHFRCIDRPSFSMQMLAIEFLLSRHSQRNEFIQLIPSLFTANTMASGELSRVALSLSPNDLHHVTSAACFSRATRELIPCPTIQLAQRH